MRNAQQQFESGEISAQEYEVCPTLASTLFSTLSRILSWNHDEHVNSNVRVSVPVWHVFCIFCVFLLSVGIFRPIIPETSLAIEGSYLSSIELHLNYGMSCRQLLA